MSSPDGLKQPHYHITSLAPTQSTGLAKVGVFTHLELCDRYGAVLLIAFCEAVIGKMLYQNRQNILNDGCMLSRPRGLKRFSRCFKATVSVFYAVNKIMRVFILVPLVKRIGLQTREADDVGMPNGIGRNAIFPEQFRTDFFGNYIPD